MMFPSRFSLAVSGNGDLLELFVEKLVERFPGIIIYDRNEEAARDSSDEEHPPIPQVAYVDVLFTREDGKEHVTIHCFHRHRFFNYDMKETLPGSNREQFLMESMLNAVAQLSELPKEKALPEPEVPDISEEPAVSKEPEQTEPEPTETDQPEQEEEQN